MSADHRLEQIIDAHDGTSDMGLSRNVALTPRANEGCSHSPAEKVGDEDSRVHALGWA
jgi:hypothetical protein